MNIVLFDALNRPIQKPDQAIVKRHNQFNAGRSGQGLLLITHLFHPFHYWDLSLKPVIALYNSST